MTCTALKKVTSTDKIDCTRSCSVTRSSSFGLVTTTSSLLICYPLAARRVSVHGNVFRYCILYKQRRFDARRFEPRTTAVVFVTAEGVWKCAAV